MLKVDRSSIQKKTKIKKWKISKADHERIIEDGIPLEFFLLNCPTIYSLWTICFRTSSTQLKIELLMLFVQVFAHIQIFLVLARALVPTESTFSIQVH